ncbi:uncharacterized protein LOC143921561 [Arctopsyche grandis]|uniref:uncharacterized protein LOC143921561 n=1 Tax=Arctopsyche grandis TaxID=121162 RepID=UPI00406D8013
MTTTTLQLDSGPSTAGKGRGRGRGAERGGARVGQRGRSCSHSMVCGRFFRGCWGAGRVGWDNRRGLTSAADLTGECRQFEAEPRRPNRTSTGARLPSDRASRTFDGFASLGPFRLSSPLFAAFRRSTADEMF